MKIKFPLYAQTISLLAANLVLLLVLGFLLFFSRLQFGWEAIIASPFGERVQEISWAITRTMEPRPQSDWDSILDEFGKTYGVRFFLFDERGKELAGQKIELPKSVLERAIIPHPHPGMWNHPPGFQPQGGPPPDFSRQSFPPPGFEHPGGPPHDGHEPFAPPGGPPADGHDHFAPPGGPPADGHDPFAPPRGSPADGHDHFAPSGGPPGPMGINAMPPFPPHHRYLEHTSNPDCFWIVVRVPFRMYQRGMPVPLSLVAQADNLWQTRIFFDFAPVVFFVCAVLILSLLFWTPFAYRLSKNLQKLTRATEQIAEGRFDTKLDHNTVDELGLLGESINKMGDRLNNFVTGEKRFLGDIAHELCSPIARLRVAYELLEETQDGSQTQLLQDIREEIDEMSNLINELLDFSKAGLQGSSVTLVSLNALELLTEVANRNCAEEVVKIQVPADLWFIGDKTLLQRAFGNLIRNSVRYAGSGANISIEGLEKAGKANIKIVDDGPGVPPDIVHRLGEPFFRPEPSRNRSSGGVGLGLAIVQACVKACNGSFKISNRVPHGLAVEIDLPLAAPSQR